MSYFILEKNENVVGNIIITFLQPMKDLIGFNIRSSYFKSRKKILHIDPVEAKARANVGEIVSDVDAIKRANK